MDEGSIDEIYKVKNTDLKIIHDEYKKWLDQSYTMVLPKSSLGKAMNYSIRNFEKLSNYLLDGRLEISNNLVLS